MPVVGLQLQHLAVARQGLGVILTRGMQRGEVVPGVDMPWFVPQGFEVGSAGFLGSPGRAQEDGEIVERTQVIWLQRESPPVGVLRLRVATKPCQRGPHEIPAIGMARLPGQ